MKCVWKCDHCSETKASFYEMGVHETKCSFNPINRYCYTCKHHENDGFYIFGESYSCLIKLSTDNGEEDGFCKGWVDETS